jgi:phosphate acetyltransferase
MTLVEKIKARAAVRPQRIVLPEGEDPRIVSAAAAVAQQGFAKIALLGRKQIINAVAADLRVALGSVPIVDPAESARADTYAQIYYDRRRSRGITLDEARDIART